MPQFQEHVLLSGFTNYRIGGPARFFFEARSAADVEWAVREAKKSGLPLFIFGGGTNLLVRDEGFPGLVLKPNIRFLETDGGILKAGAGSAIEDLLTFTVRRGLSGLEWAGGLPGTVGGAIRGNAGAFGGEIKDAVQSAESFDVDDMRPVRRRNTECDFSYRSSVFKKKGGKEIVLSATFSLKRGNPKEIAAKIEEKIHYRRERHPLEYPNIGSIFKNVPLAQMYTEGTQEYAEAVRTSTCNLRGAAIPIKTDPFPVAPTAYLISEAGLKGVRVGGAVISPKHPNFIVNVGGAKAADVLELIALIKRKVLDRFGIILEEEVEII